ncbi:hypothetical protein PsYK624_155260 [Phanerochaete sordida]|uniref:Uncharacterized protein n=1 Tax=Phanerochaete sordida TaxID=48140 RepID=A0A9P3GP10_9APHY|nr:hypothetical protein PsYK624_155260 [Phanerochaete sordida]
MSTPHAYPFLSQPPHGQDIYAATDAASVKHTRRRSLAAISNWASNVQPGAPAPVSPSKAKFAPESSRAPEIRAARRHSVKPAPPPPMEYIPDSPSGSDQSGSPAAKQAFKADLRPTEYAPVYVQLPHTPPPDAPKGKGLRFLSLKSAPRAPKDAGAPPPPPKEKKEKKEKKRREDVPMQLATDLALAQLLGGGTIEHHIRQAAERDAKRAGARREGGTYAGVADVYRDADGRVWRDRDEAWEYQALVGRTREEPDEAWACRDRRARTQGDASPVSSLESYDAPAHHGKSKRRPEPLDLAGSRPSTSSRRHHGEDARREFLESSFASEGAGGTKSRSGLLNMFKSSKKGGQ